MHKILCIHYYLSKTIDSYFLLSAIKNIQTFIYFFSFSICREQLLSKYLSENMNLLIAHVMSHIHVCTHASCGSLQFNIVNIQNYLSISLQSGAPATPVNFL